MSSLLNTSNANNTVDDPYHPIYQCSQTKCVEYFKRHTMKYSNISNTNIPIKKLVMCMHCGNSWFVCTACVKAFRGARYTIDRHFRTIHKWKSSHVMLPSLLINQHTLQQNTLDDDTSATYENDDDNQQITLSSNTNNNNQTCRLQRFENAEMEIDHKEIFTSNMEKKAQVINN